MMTVRFSYAFAATMMLLAVIGLWRDYPPIPLADIWDGGFLTYLQFRSGDWSALWQPFNAHRIVLTRLLLWPDIAWFGGTGFPVALVNVCYPLIAAALFAQIFKTIWPDDHKLRAGLSALACGFFSVWGQRTTFIAPFQLQMILAILLPLAALWLDSRGRPHAAGLTAVAALGSMANGMFAAPSLALAAALKRQWRRMGAYAVLAAVSGAVYSIGLSQRGLALSPPAPSPLAYPVFVLELIGNPLARVIGSNEIPAIFGVFWCLIAAVTLRNLIHLRRLTATDVLLLVFIGYFLLSAALAARGRASLESGNTARYVTIALFAWLALATLFLSTIDLISNRRALLIAGTGLCALTLLAQLSVLLPRDGRFPDQLLGTLAFVMHVNDPPALKGASLDVAPMRASAGQARAAGLSPLARYPYGAVDGSAPHATASLAACPVTVTAHETIPEDEAHLRIFGETQNDLPQLLAFAEENGTVIGYALTRKSGGVTRFAGYIARSATAFHVIAISAEGPRCKSATLTLEQSP